MKFSSIIASLLATATLASAHGIVADITVDGKKFQGNKPGGSTNPSVIRQVSAQDPTKGATNPDINCGPDATAASLVADVNPGSVMTFDWREADFQGKWPHNTGPMLTYMASCGDQTCDKFDSTTAKWFKVQQVGQDSDGKWAQAALMTGGVATVNIPKNIAPGNYLVRHEIIALHLAMTKGGAEFYPSCTQVRIGGNGSGQPTADELVSLPGAYSDTDPGILTPDVFNPGFKYNFPGPQIAKFVGDDTGSDSSSGSSSGSGNTGNSGNNSGSSTSSSTPPQSSSNNSSQNSSGSCKLKKKPSSSAAAAATASASMRPRHISRVMRNIGLGSSGH